MSRGRDKKEVPPTAPIIRRAPLPELKIYEITEGELETLARGSPASIFLNFALFLQPIGFTLMVTLLTTTIGSIRLFAAFVAVAAVTLIIGFVLLALWWRDHSSTRDLVEAIRNRMPPPSVQDSPGIPGGNP